MVASTTLDRRLRKPYIGTTKVIVSSSTTSVFLLLFNSARLYAVYLCIASLQWYSKPPVGRLAFVWGVIEVAREEEEDAEGSVVDESGCGCEWNWESERAIFFSYICITLRSKLAETRE
jgi:hypothetical protein